MKIFPSHSPVYGYSGILVSYIGILGLFPSSAITNNNAVITLYVPFHLFEIVFVGYMGLLDHRTNGFVIWVDMKGAPYFL